MALRKRRAEAVHDEQLEGSVGTTMFSPTTYEMPNYRIPSLEVARSTCLLDCGQAGRHRLLGQSNFLQHDRTHGYLMIMTRWFLAMLPLEKSVEADRNSYKVHARRRKGRQRMMSCSVQKSFPLNILLQTSISRSFLCREHASRDQEDGNLTSSQCEDPDTNTTPGCH